MLLFYRIAILILKKISLDNFFSRIVRFFFFYWSALYIQDIFPWSGDDSIGNIHNFRVKSHKTFSWKNASWRKRFLRRYNLLALETFQFQISVAINYYQSIFVENVGEQVDKSQSIYYSGLRWNIFPMRRKIFMELSIWW